MTPRLQAPGHLGDGFAVMDNNVRHRRSKLGISQADLGVAMGVSRQTINSIEKGRYLPSLPLALALARYFKTTVEEIFDHEAGNP